ncbi:TIGR03086 family metal-binding protein [Catenuloplanes sp. NPDC051500]|uniref:TIGR03086 family metal-binding protein n=1 Tax=Catenuloplanes sp. NPDC051500 TaxID=3363959 RepID=UPI0037877AF4
MTAIFTVLDDLDRVTSSITPDQETLPTPCTGLDVHTLRGHLLGWLHYFDAALRDPSGTDRPDPDAHPDPSTAKDQINTLADAVRSARPDATVNVPRLGGAYPTSVVLDLLQAEALGHGWDLARATGQPWNPDPAACAHTLTVLRATVQPEFRGDGLPFGPEVPIGDDAPALDRLVAFTGRRPDWAPAV